MDATAERHEFRAEVQEILNLVIHSLYSNREIFLRELVSNASDALDKRHLEGLTRPEIAADPSDPWIEIEVDREARTLAVRDDGIGMSHDELVENLGTIARSGTRRFLEELREARGTDMPRLIGQFGVGFYASFMVADRIEVETRRAGSEEGWRWQSTGQGEFQIEPAADAAVGTTVRLHLKPATAEGEEPLQEFADPALLRGLVKRYSDFVGYPIRMDAEHFPGEQGEETAEGGRVVVLNSRRPLWARAKDEIEPEEHAEFYRHLAHGWGEPLETIHFRAEGTNEYTALLYLPRERPLDLLDPEREKSRVALYVRRVFVMADCEDVVPPWLRFVRGVVDSEDLPLNVSREILQENRAARQIKSRVARKVLDALEGLLRDRREDYVAFWRELGGVVKEGIVTDDESRDRIAALALFESTREGGPWTLDDYVERMGEGQEAIYYVCGDDASQLAASPHLEAPRARGFEVLLLTDPVDEWVVHRLNEYSGRPLKSVERGLADYEGDAEKEEREKLDREHRGLLGAMELHLGDAVKEVRFSSRLKDSPAVLVTDEAAMSARMERMLRAGGQEVPAAKRILELNAGHPLVERMEAMHTADPASDGLRDYSRLLLGQAELAEGSPLADPAEFARLVAGLMVDAAGE